ncbi:methyl-accepting chemotaxis protein [Salinisphaera sp.]|uniref:methyl-accepting chemotaxis protein n=1 Tax=Salinisphaera sp. TaxID=1914330 RepID=UPI000C43FE4E|nr:methyl-accepting chemotaxis protein [Salinisphaera sp.]MBS63103.1 chemotaxis protein [Salinisphaera sp.]
MLKRLNQINVKYAIAFITVALAMFAVVVVDLMLVHTLKERMREFGGPFLDSTSAVLNADRDLYQAHVATLEYMRMDPASELAATWRAEFDTNAEQAKQRLESFAQSMAAYPDVLTALDGFDALYSTWLNASKQVLQLRGEGNYDQAREILNTEVEHAFVALREVYDRASIAADEKIHALESAALARANTQEYAVIGFSVLVGLITLIVALVGPLMMSRAIRAVTLRIKEITEGDGDLTARIETRRTDELGDLAVNFNAFVGRMDGTLQTVRTSVSSVHGAANEIAQGSQALASRTEQSAASLEQTSASMEEINATVANTAEAADQANELTRSTVDAAHQGQQAMRDMATTMSDIATSAGEINTITTLMDGIAFQTNLLALNASVEAARAGEHGRGFSVVAQEVRNLASRAADASRQIRALSDTSVSHTESGTRLVRETGLTMEDIVSRIERVTEVVAQIRNGAREQSEGVSQINTAVTELDGATQHNAAMVEQTSAAAVQMREQADQLQALLASFRLSSDTGSQTIANDAAPTGPESSHAGFGRTAGGAAA